MYSRNVDYANVPFATMTNDDRIVVVVFRKISQVFSSSRRKTFRENSRRCVPATVATVACIKNGALGCSLNVDTRIGFAPNPRANWLSAIMICRPSVRYRIRGSSWECIFIPFAFQSLLASFSSPTPFAFSFRVSLSQQIAERITINTELLLFILISSDVLYSIVSLQKYIYHYFSALWLLKTYR